MREQRKWPAAFGPADRSRPATYTGDRGAKLAARDRRKGVRLATVGGYVVAVSLAAVFLAIYYSVIWTPTAGTRTKTGSAGSGAGGTKCGVQSCKKNCLDRNDDVTDNRSINKKSIELETSHVTSADRSTGPDRSTLSRTPAGVLSEVPSTRSPAPPVPPLPDQGFTSPAPSSAEPPAVIAEDPSNLPTEQDPEAAAGWTETDNSGSGTED